MKTHEVLDAINTNLESVRFVAGQTPVHDLQGHETTIGRLITEILDDLANVREDTDTLLLWRSARRRGHVIARLERQLIRAKRDKIKLSERASALEKALILATNRLKVNTI